MRPDAKRRESADDRARSRRRRPRRDAARDRRRRARRGEPPGCRELGLERVAAPTGDRSLVGREGARPRRKSVNSPLGPRKARSQATISSSDVAASSSAIARVRMSSIVSCAVMPRPVPTLPVSGHEKTPRQGRGVSTRYHPASPACRRARICPLTMGLGTTTRRAWRVHRPAREGTSPPRHPAVLSRDRRPCQARRRVLVSVSAISFDVVAGV